MAAALKRNGSFPLTTRVGSRGKELNTRATMGSGREQDWDRMAEAETLTLGTIGGGQERSDAGGRPRSAGSKDDTGARG